MTLTDDDRALREDKAPPIGVEIIARPIGGGAFLRGRVIASGPNTATLLPLDGGKAERVAGQEVVCYPGVYEVSRPHPGAPWKAATSVACEVVDKDEARRAAYEARRLAAKQRSD
jgi:hypothetical protein